MLKCDIKNNPRTLEFNETCNKDTFTINFMGEKQVAMHGVDANGDDCLIILCGKNQGLVTWDSREWNNKDLNIRLIDLKVVRDED